ncbi:MAG TPA: PH domain-containing protein [Caldilineaceae bacterium]|nr:PH domain-containing protein [Caldilineaceae bacterium]
MKHFKAPWGVPLIIMSALASVICLAATILLWQPPTLAQIGHYSFWLRLLPLGLLTGCALFVVRGYTLTPDTLLIHRLFWATRLPLADLQSAEFQPRAMRGSIRTFGNGGFFSFTGYYWSRALGSYRAYVTDFERTAILRFPQRTIVLSPEPPEAFVQELSPHPRNA